MKFLYCTVTLYLRPVRQFFLLDLPMQSHYIAKQGYYIFSRATKILKLVALLATNDLSRIFTPDFHKKFSRITFSSSSNIGAAKISCNFVVYFGRLDHLACKRILVLR